MQRKDIFYPAKCNWKRSFLRNKQYICFRIGSLLGMMEDYMEKMILSLKQLMASSAFKMTDWKQNGLFSVIKLLLNGKFRSLASTAKKYIEVSKKGGRLLDPIWTDLAENFVTFKRFLHFLCDHDVWKIHNSSSNPRVFTYFM